VNGSTHFCCPEGSLTWRPPIVTVFFPEGLRIEATATARAVFG
jgi:hypothetical protein